MFIINIYMFDDYRNNDNCILLLLLIFGHAHYNMNIQINFHFDKSTRVKIIEFKCLQLMTV